MNPETINQIKDLLIPVAEKLGQGGEYAWTVLVKGQFAEGVAGLVTYGVFGIIILALIVTAARAKGELFDERNPGKTVVCSIVFFISCGYLGALMRVQEPLMQVISPEYAAMKFLIEEAKK